MAAALIHFAVIEQHWAENGLDGRSLSRWGRLSWPGRRPSPRPLPACCCGAVGNALLVCLAS